MSEKMKQALQDALDEILGMSTEELEQLLEEARKDPLYGIFQTLEDMGRVLYQEYDSTQYNMNMPWEGRNAKSS